MKMMLRFCAASFVYFFYSNDDQNTYSAQTAMLSMVISCHTLNGSYSISSVVVLLT